MNAALLVLQADEPQWLKLLLFALFFVVPMLARLFKKAVNPEGEEQSEELDPREQRRRAREERRRAEEEGEDLWKRLARGEEPAAPPPSRVPVPVLLEAEAEEATEDLSEPAPLAMLGEVSEPADVTAVSLEQEVEPEPLSVLGEAKPLEAPGEVLRARFRLERGELRRTVVLQEILAPPLALRGGG